MELFFLIAFLFFLNSLLPLPDSSLSRPDTLIFFTAGDLMTHIDQVKAADTGNGYNFLPSIQTLKPILDSADAAWANLETLLWDEDSVFYGYPRFRTPPAFGQAVKDVGFTGVWTANNHSFDWETTGIQSSVRQLDSIGIPFIGIRDDTTDPTGYHRIPFGSGYLLMANYTYGVNGGIPDSSAWMVPFIDTTQMKNDISGIDSSITDSLPNLRVVSLHWGNQYDSLPSKQQRKLAAFLANLGTDIIIGHHPHVIQPVEWIPKPNGDSCLVIWSLGNLISAQRTFPRAIGGLIKIEILNESGRFQILGYRFIPTWVQQTTNRQFILHPATQEFINKTVDPPLKKALKAARRHISGILSPSMID